VADQSFNALIGIYVRKSCILLIYYDGLELIDISFIIV